MSDWSADVCSSDLFGLVMIEAMAVGTPVVAFPAGSVPEIVEDGLTGFVVDGTDDAVEMIRHLDELDRGAVRRRFEERFSAADRESAVLGTRVSVRIELGGRRLRQKKTPDNH